MQSKSKNRNIKKSSTPRVNDTSAFFNHVCILMKRLLDLEYQIRFFKASFPEAFEHVKNFRDAILNDLMYIEIPEETINNLKLVDSVYDYIQFRHLNFNFDFLDLCVPPGEDFMETINNLKNKFFDQLDYFDPINNWSKQKKDFIFLNVRFADMSAGNDLDEVLRTYLQAKARFGDVVPPNTTVKLKDSLKGFFELRLPAQRAVSSAFVNYNKVEIGEFSDNYLTLNVRNFESPEAIPFVLTNFLVEYLKWKIACSAYNNENGEPSHNVLKEADAINKLIQTIDKQYMTSSSFNKHTTHLPHILGLMQWDIKQNEPKNVKEIINKKLSDLEQEFDYLGDLTQEADTLGKQLEKTESLIAALKEEWRMTL